MSDVKACLVGATWDQSGDGAIDADPFDLKGPPGVRSQADAATVADAIGAARAALPAWSRASPQVRGDALVKTSHVG